MSTDPFEWEPYCGAEYRSGEIAGGGPVTCVRNAHGPDSRHKADNGWEWWLPILGIKYAPEEVSVLAVAAAIAFVIGLILKLAGGSLGRMDPVAWGLLGLVFLALHAAFNWPLRRP